MKPLRFCMITTFYPPYNFGGDGIGIQRLCHALVRRGHEVTVVHDIDAYKLSHRGDEPAPFEQPPGLTTIGLRTRLPVVSKLLTHQLGRPVFERARLRQVLSDGPFDVINYHNVSLIGGPGLFALGEAVKIYMAHEHWLVCPTHVLWRHGREVCTGRQCLRCTLHYRRPPQLWRATGWLERQLHHIDTFVAMSEFSRDKHAQFGFPRDMEVLPYFLPDDTATPAPDQAPHHRPYFLFVGRLERIKGLDDVIPLFRNYRDADLLIAGEGSQGAALRDLARGTTGVHFLGRVEAEQLPRLYAHCLALVVPSVCFETFGITVIEAFQQGAPVIARRHGPLPEILDKGGGGLLFGDRAELQGALQTLQRDPHQRAELATAARRGFEQHWSEGVVVERYLDIVRRAAERRAASDHRR